MRCNIQSLPRCISFTATPIRPHKYDVSLPPLYITFSIRCVGIDWQVSHLVSHLTQALNQTSAVPSNVVDLTIMSYFDSNMPIREYVNDTE